MICLCHSVIQINDIYHHYFVVPNNTTANDMMRTYLYEQMFETFFCLDPAPHKIRFKQPRIRGHHMPSRSVRNILIFHIKYWGTKHSESTAKHQDREESP